jgi:hypothetical protein
MIAAVVHEYIRRGWRIVPIPRGEKAPKRPRWGELKISLEDVSRYFENGDNIGIILGPKSESLVDVDLDCAEALEIADLYLPVTRAEFGRRSKPRSHRIFIAVGVVHEAFTDPINGTTLLELRGEGRDGGCHQTIFPPSVHPSGEQIAWYGDIIAPAIIDAAALRLGVAWLALGCLVMRYASAHAARNPEPDLPRILWEFDHTLGRAAYQWVGQAVPEAPQRQLRPRKEWSRRDLDLAEIVNAIRNNCSWEDWNKIGLAIYAVSNGSDDGSVIFDDWSAKSPKYNPYNTADRWAAFHRCPPTRIGMGTLIYLAKQAGWRPPEKAR